MRRAAPTACTAAIRRRWKPCWHCLSPRCICVLDRPGPVYNASPPPAATPKPPSACNTPSADSSNSCSGRRTGRGNDGPRKIPERQNRGFPFVLGKRKKRASPIPTAPTAAIFFQNLIPKGAFLRHSLDLSFRLILRLEKTPGVSFVRKTDILASGPELD